MDENINSSWNRRSFLKLTGGGLALSLIHLKSAFSPTFADELSTGARSIEYNSWEDIYRNEWQWDNVSWGSHTNQCAPGGCSWRVYSRNGLVWREEQTARSDAANSNYPDFNPQGCQKGCGFHQVLTAPERITHPLKRVGNRGEGKWQRVSWDQALEEIADAILDAHRDFSTESFIIDAPHIHAGPVALAGCSRLGSHLNALTPELNVEIGDDLKGIGQTFGKMNQGYTADNFYDAELIILTQSNVSYTWPSSFHFITEARYNGTEVILLAPDYNATALAADVHIPIKVATDAALWLSICQVMIEEELFNSDFVKEQTDLALLVRKDTGRYLRASDLSAGTEQQLYFYDLDTSSLVIAPRATLEFKGNQSLSGEYPVTLTNGSTTTVVPVFEVLKEKLNSEYRPEQAATICAVHEDTIRMLARKVATKTTCSYIGFSSAKHYHGDLMERSHLLAMALSGNWGKPGTGFNCFIVPDVGIGAVSSMEREPNSWLNKITAVPMLFDVMSRQLKDPDLTDEILGIDFAIEFTKKHGTVPPVFYMYNHVGYDKLWDKPEWAEPGTGKVFGDYLRESIDRGYWDEEQIKPTPEQPPQVLMLMANNPLRRQRSGRRTYVEDFLPTLKMAFAIEPKMSSSAAYCDIVLPAAWYYEKDDMTMTFGLNPYNALIEKAVEPPGEAKPEWEIFTALMDKISERAAKRGMKSFTDRWGKERKYAQLSERYTLKGFLPTQKEVLKVMIKMAAKGGTFPADFDYEKFRKVGQIKAHGMGKSVASASDFDPDKPFYSLAWHVDKKLVYPTYARRAQFYIDHEWFIDANEALPTHKDTPPIGGHYPFKIISGHVRNSIHSIQTTSPAFLRLHRGEPILFINDQVAKDKNIKDADRVKIFNDLDQAEFMACLSPSVGPTEVVVYMWENFQFENWKSHDAMLVGMPKGLQMAGNYGQLNFRQSQGSPSPSSDRGLMVGLERVDEHISESTTETIIGLRG